MIVNINDVHHDLINLIKIWRDNNLKKIILTILKNSNNLFNLQKKIILSNDHLDINIRIEYLDVIIWLVLREHNIGDLFESK